MAVSEAAHNGIPDLRNGNDAAPLLCVQNLSVAFADRGSGWGRGAARTVVDAVSFEVRAGETLGLVGESGSGKTTVGRAVLALVPRSCGSVRFEGADVGELRGPRLKAFRRRAQIIFQDPGGSLDPRVRVWETVAEPLIVHEAARGRDELRSRAAAALERCGLGREALDRYPHQFSGGQKQRIAIARALVLSPALVVCDEPTSALDVSVQAQVLNLLSELQRELGMAYLFISHDLGVVGHMCHRIAVMRAGKIIEIGERDEVLGGAKDDYTRSLLAAASAGAGALTT